MKLKYLAHFLICLLSGNLFARTKTDVLVMNNGDRLTCEIKKMERGVLYAGFDYVDGTVAIAWDKIVRVESSQLFVVNTQNGNYYEGSLKTAETEADQPVSIEIREEKDNGAKMPQKEVVQLAQTSQNFLGRISANFDSGLIYSKGNNNTQYNFGAGAHINRELWSGSADYTSALSKSSGTTASTRYQTRIKALRRIGENQWFYNGAVEFLQSSQQGIEIQSSVAGGIGKFFKDTNSARISASTGLVWQGTRYVPSNGVQSPPNSIGAMFNADIHLFRFKKTTLDLYVSAIPILTEIGRVRSYVNSAYSIQIISNLWFKLSFYGSWDNRPPSQFSGSDYGASSGISYSFN